MDLAILNFIQEHIANPVLNAIMPFFSAIGEFGTVWIVASILMICSKKYRKYGIMALLAMTIGLLIGEVAIKNIVCRDRPCVAYPIDNMIVSIPHSYSFPSGHTCSSLASATIIFIANKKWGIVAFALALLIAFSRLYNYVHYPTDVLAGAVLGVLSALTAYFVVEKINKSKGLKL